MPPIHLPRKRSGPLSFTGGRADRGRRRRGAAELRLESLETRVLLATDVLVPLFGNEPAAAVMSPRDPNLVAVARGSVLALSTDGGVTFPTTVNAQLPAGQGALNYGFAGDSVLSFDADERLFWTYLTRRDVDGDGNLETGDGDDLSVAVLRINARTGTAVGGAVDLTPGAFIDDKCWIAADANEGGPFENNIYVVWSRLDSPSRIMFSRSIDNGATFSAPAQLSPGGEGDEGFEWPSHVAVAPNGDVYAAWHVPGDDAANGRIRMVRSGNGAADWVAGNVTFTANPFTNGQAGIDDNVQTDAATIPQTDFWTQGAYAPYILPDPVRPNHIYVVANDDPNNAYGSGDDGDVVFATSTDNGATWSTKTISHGPVGSLQVFPIGAIDQDGNIVVTWYDTRRGQTNAGGNFLLDLYATASLDGGGTFSNDFRVNDATFNPDLNAPQRFPGPPPTLRIGEYNGLAVANGVVAAVWTGNNAGGNQQTFFDTFRLDAAFPDAFEGNDDQSVATVLGSPPAVTVENLTIHNEDDEDWFRITANQSGVLSIKTLFRDQLGNLDLFVYDRNNVDDSGTHRLASGTSADDDEEVIIPVVAQQSYFIQVVGVGADTNSYDLEIENFAAPVPDLVDLDPANDSGSSNSDNVTFFSGPRVFIQADLSGFADQGITILTPGQVTTKTPGAAVQVFLDGVSFGFATEVAGTNHTLFEFRFDIGSFNEGLHYVTAAVRMFDAKRSVAGNPDPATGRSQLSEPLVLVLDQTVPSGLGGAGSAPDLLATSDSGSSETDNVTNVNPPAFQGVGEANAQVRIRANGLVVGSSIVGSDASDGVFGNGLGTWEITTEPLHDGRYSIVAEYEDAAGNIVRHTSFLGPGEQPLPPLAIEIDTLEPNTAYLDLADASDTGRSNYDNVTRDNTPDVSMTTEDPNKAIHLIPQNYKYRVFDRAGTGAETLIYDSAADAAVPKVDGLTTLEFLAKTLPVLADGVHDLKLEVEDRAGNISHDFLLVVTIDTVAPANPTIRLDADSDSGVEGAPLSFADLVTSDTVPGFTGRAEADAIVRLWGDSPPVSAGVTAGEDKLLGFTVALPWDGNLAFPNGQWNLTSGLDLNNPVVGFAIDGWRQITGTAEDLAGNESSRATPGVFDMFVDTFGPQIAAVHIASDPAYNLFGLKPNDVRPTPLVHALTIDVVDPPPRDTVNFPNHRALDSLVAATPGHYVVRGDHVGVVAISSVIVVNLPLVNGQPARATITLNFAEPLPDDRFTLSIADALVDPAGNNLDGDTDLLEPLGTPIFPTGDLQPGGSFAARFTVDSRPEIGTYAAASVFIDINGNGYYDPPGQTHDDTNRDLVFTLGLAPSIQGLVAPMGVNDRVFAGDFRHLAGAAELIGGGPPQPDFDKLAAYGYDAAHGSFRWLVDTNRDGIINPAAGDVYTFQPAGYQLDGLPVAGNFDRNGANGDEIGLYVPTAGGSTWYFDMNKDYVLNAADAALGGVVATAIKGTPITGDFDGNGVVDLATWRDSVYYFAFAQAVGWSAGVDDTINFGFPGVAPLPVAADMDQDGITDVGLFVPRRSGSTPPEDAEWYFLISGFTGDERSPSLGPGGIPLSQTLKHAYSPTPLGRDLFFQFGDEFAQPIVGNFDPPPAKIDVADALAAVELGPLLGTRQVTTTVAGTAWYTFTPLRSGTLELSAGFDRLSGNVQVNLYDANLAHLTGGSLATDGQATLGFELVAGQTYAVRVVGRNEAVDLVVHNEVDIVDRLDASRDGFVSPRDALVIINALNADGAHALAPLAIDNPELFLDTTLDGQISPLDVLVVINHLNGEPASPADPLPRALVGTAASAPLGILGVSVLDQAFGMLGTGSAQTASVAQDDLALAAATLDERPGRPHKPRANPPFTVLAEFDSWELS